MKKINYLIILVNFFVFYFLMCSRLSLRAIKDLHVGQILFAQNIKAQATEATFQCKDGGYENIETMATSIIQNINQSNLSDPTHLNLAFVSVLIAFILFYFSLSNQKIKLAGLMINFFGALIYFALPQIT